MTFTITPFAPEHLQDWRSRETGFERLYKEALLQMDNCLAFSGWLNGRLLAIGGLLLLWPGVAAGLFLTSDEVAQQPLLFFFAGRRRLRRLWQEQRLHRLEVNVPQGDVASQLWLERLGLRREGEMPCYGPDQETYIRYARTAACP